MKFLSLVILLGCSTTISYAIKYSIDEHERFTEFIGNLSKSNGFENLWLEREKLFRNEVKYWRFIENNPQHNL